MPKQTLRLLNETFCIHSFPPETHVPPSVYSAPIYFISKTYDELSIVCPQRIHLSGSEFEQDWTCLEVLGPLGFSLTGILANISGVLATAKISIFAVSTFDTDYILVKQDSMDMAISALNDNGYQILR